MNQSYGPMYGNQPPVWQWQQPDPYGPAVKQLRRHANAIGFGLLMTEAIGTVAVLVVTYILTMFFPNIKGPNVYYDAIEYALYAPLAVGLPFVLAAKFARRPLGALVPFKKHSPGLGIGCVLLCFGFVAVGNFITGVVLVNSPGLEEKFAVAMGADPVNWLELVVYLLQVAAIPAIVEEFAYRGVVMGLLRPFGNKRAILVSALVFGIMHGNFVQMPFAFILGLGLGYITVRTGSIVPAIVVHFINNASSGLLTYFDGWLTAYVSQNYGLLLYAVWLVAGAIGLAVLLLGYHSQPSVLKETADQGLLPANKRNVALFGSVLLWIGMGIFVASAVLFSVA